MSSSGGFVEFSRQTISLNDQEDIHQVLRAMSGEQDLIVVNIAASAARRPVPLSQENLDAILSEVPQSLFVETLPHREFKKLLRDDIGLAIESAVGLRARLRADYVNDLQVQVREFLSRLEQILVMINCYALQKSKSAVGGGSEKLKSAVGQLSASSFELGDNVLCMDDLEYQILPSLRLLQKTFQEIGKSPNLPISVHPGQHFPGISFCVLHVFVVSMSPEGSCAEQVVQRGTRIPQLLSIIHLLDVNRPISFMSRN